MGKKRKQGRGGKGKRNPRKPQIRLSNEEIATISANLYADSSEWVDLISKAVACIPFSKPLTFMLVIRHASTICSAPETSLASELLRQLSDQHNIFSRPFIREFILSPKFQIDAFKLVQLLQRALDLCGEVDIDIKLLEAARALYPSMALLLNAVTERLQAAEQRRIRLEAEAKELAREQGIDLGTYSGIQRVHLGLMPGFDELRGTAEQPPLPRVSAGFDSVDALLDTMFSLERSNFVIPLQESLKAHFEGRKVDHRDMLHLRDCRVTHVIPDPAKARLTLALSFPRPRRAGAGMLNYGRLVLLSHDGWGTSLAAMSLGSMDPPKGKGRGRGQYAQVKVDGKPGERGSVPICLLPAMSHLPPAGVHGLLTGRVEAFTFGDGLVTAYEPIMKSLRDRPAGDIPFGGVLAGFDQEMPAPKWVRGTVIDVSTLYPGLDGVTVLPTDMHWPGELHGPPAPAGGCCADPTQLAGVRHTMRNAVSVIKGGPGTGKTFSAKLMLEMFYKARRDNHISSPVILLTYTNHALDSLLEGVLQFAPASSVIRIGGRMRSENPELIARQVNRCRREISNSRGLGIGEAYNHKEHCYHAVTSKAQQVVLLSSLQGAIPQLMSGRARDTLPQLQQVLTANVFSHEQRGQLSFRRMCPVPRMILGVKGGVKYRPLRRVSIPHFDRIESMLQRAAAAGKKGIKRYRDFLAEADDEHCLLEHWITGRSHRLLQIVKRTEEYLKAMTRRAKKQLRFKGLADEAAPEKSPSAIRSPSPLPRDASPRQVEVEEAPENSDLESSDPFSLSSESDDAGDVHRSIYEGLRGDDSVIQTSFDEDRVVFPPDLWSLSPHQVRRSLQQIIESAGQAYNHQDIAQGVLTLEGSASALRKLQDQSLLAGIRSNTIAFVGLTATAAASHIDMLRAMQPSVMLVEEAGELRESQMLACLPSTLKHIVCIGDFEQLRPKVEHKLTSVHFDWSQLERLTYLNIPRVDLHTQRRMRPEICGLINAVFDQELITDAPASTISGPLATLQQPVFFLQHSHAQDAATVSSRSHSNSYEADMLLELCPVLCNNGIAPHDIAIIALYKGQFFLIRRKLKAMYERLKKQEKKSQGRSALGSFKLEDLLKIRVVVLDGFQGEESRAVLVSLVRSDRPGFVKTRNRALVTLSRAKEVMVVAGHESVFGAASRAPAGAWHHVFTEHMTTSPSPLVGTGSAIPLGCAHHGTGMLYSRPEQLSGTGWAMGGCSRPCNTRLMCGHTCGLPCHGGEHTVEAGFRCMKRCPNRCTRGHQCRAACHKCSNDGECMPCTVTVEHTFPCGHTAPVPCSKVEEDPLCPCPCGKPRKDCGHLCKLPCGHQDPCRSAKCPTKVKVTCNSCKKPFVQQCSLVGPTSTAQKRLAACPYPCSHQLAGCGHPCTSTCGGCATRGRHVVCVQRHYRVLGCGHVCAGTCGHEGDCYCDEECQLGACSHGACPAACGVPCPLCQQPCSLGCEHQKCTKLCHEQCDHPPCNERCSQTLVCGCRCRGVCGSPCPPCPLHEKDAYAHATSMVMMCPLLEELEEDPAALVYYIPTCGHLFLTHELDMLMTVKEKGLGDEMNVTITCPAESCRIVLNLANAPRYERLLKEVLRRNRRVQLLMREVQERVEQEIRETHGELTADELKEVQHAMGEDQRHYGTGGHFFQHACGYIYMIGDCGGAAMIGQCPKCGGQIGGANYQLVEGNTSADFETGMAWASMETGARLKDTSTAGLTPQQKELRALQLKERKRVAAEEEVRQARIAKLRESTRLALARHEEMYQQALERVAAMVREKQVPGRSDAQYSHQYSLSTMEPTSPDQDVQRWVRAMKTAGATVTRVQVIHHPRRHRLHHSGRALVEAYHGTNIQNLGRIMANGGCTTDFLGISHGQALGAGVYFGQMPILSYSSGQDIAGERVMLVHMVDTRNNVSRSQNVYVIPHNDDMALVAVLWFT